MAVEIEIKEGEVCPDCGTTSGCTITRPEYDGDGAYYCGGCGEFMPCSGHVCEDRSTKMDDRLFAVKCARTALDMTGGRDVHEQASYDVCDEAERGDCDNAMAAWHAAGRLEWAANRLEEGGRTPKWRAAQLACDAAKIAFMAANRNPGIAALEAGNALAKLLAHLDGRGYVESIDDAIERVAAMRSKS